MRQERLSGILCHPTSLPGMNPIGTLGAQALAFVDFLAAARQGLWQILPLNPTGPDGSPYNARSALAGNPLLIDLERLLARGLLRDCDLPGNGDSGMAEVDFAEADAFAEPALRAAFARFREMAPSELTTRFLAFRRAQQDWLEDYALFAALRKAHAGVPWWGWDDELARRDPAAIDTWRRRLRDEIAYQAFLQFLVDDQWATVRRYANARGVRIIGDIPIYVALDSADVWANQTLFALTPEGQPSVVAGVPPDLFSATGQLWGNPCYRWDVMAEQGYRWWAARFRRALEQCDLVRLDHFRGFAAGWQVPAGEETAIGGRWAPGPGRAFFERLAAALGPLPIIVEDLGVITDDVHQLRQELGYPGMKVLQFAFDGTGDNPYLPHNYDPNCVVYTGTHDNDTTNSWYQSLDSMARAQVDRYLGPHDPDAAWALLRLAQASVARSAIAPLQDVLSLGAEARMNTPGTAECNWRWRYRPGYLTSGLAHRLSELSECYGRAPRR
ncbi:MAG TPA: 4-alpha-glucanotransferase [Thermomicrobiaceae bacterium]|nr:4-alpha-glucanotransferase [Thermomicrobiaceae bacterium]